MRIRGLGIAVLILCGWGGVLPAFADDAVYRICSLVRHQEQVDREELELEVELAEAHGTAAESIFGLVDRLWESDAVERIVYLAARHERDVAVLDVKRSQLLLQRQEAEIEQLAGICSPLDSDETAEDRRVELEQAHRRYLQADCHRIGNDLAIAEVDLAYFSEFLASVNDLREHDVATAQDVIRAERDVEMARKRVERNGRRVQEGVDSGACAGKKKATP